LIYSLIIRCNMISHLAAWRRKEKTRKKTLSNMFIIIMLEHDLTFANNPYGPNSNLIVFIWDLMKLQPYCFQTVRKQVFQVSSDQISNLCGVQPSYLSHEQFKGNLVKHICVHCNLPTYLMNNSTETLQTHLCALQPSYSSHE
jgi:hypothetical protein